MLTPEGRWVAYRLQLKRTRNHHDSGQTATLQPGSRAAHHHIQWKRCVTQRSCWASEVTPPLPKKLRAIATLDISGVDVTGL